MYTLISTLPYSSKKFHLYPPRHGNLTNTLYKKVHTLYVENFVMIYASTELIRCFVRSFLIMESICEVFVFTKLHFQFLIKSMTI